MCARAGHPWIDRLGFFHIVSLPRVIIARDVESELHVVPGGVSSLFLHFHPARIVATAPLEFAAAAAAVVVVVVAVAFVGAYMTTGCALRAAASSALSASISALSCRLFSATCFFPPLASRSCYPSPTEAVIKRPSLSQPRCTSSLALKVSRVNLTSRGLGKWTTR